MSKSLLLLLCRFVNLIIILVWFGCLSVTVYVFCKGYYIFILSCFLVTLYGVVCMGVWRCCSLLSVGVELRPVDFLAFVRPMSVMFGSMLLNFI